MENIKTSDEEKRKNNLIRASRGQMNMGIPPEAIYSATKMAFLYIKAGARTIEEIADVLIEELGDIIRPYITNIYAQLLVDPEIKQMGIRPEMTPFEDVDNFDAEHYDDIEEEEEGGEDEENTCRKVHIFYVVDRENRRTVFLAQKGMGKVSEYAVENAVERKVREMAEQRADVLAQVKELRIMRGMAGWGLPSSLPDERDEYGMLTVEAEMVWDEMVHMILVTPEIQDAMEMVSEMTLTEENILDEEAWEEMTLYDMIERMTPSEWD